MKHQIYKHSRVIVDLTPVLREQHRYVHLGALYHVIPLSEVIEYLFAVSINNVVNQDRVSPLYNLFNPVRQGSTLYFTDLEEAMGEKFDTLSIDEIDAELSSLLNEVENRVHNFLPQGWESGEYTFDGWVGSTAIVFLKDA